MDPDGGANGCRRYPAQLALNTTSVRFRASKIWQGMEPLAAQPVSGFPERHQRFNHLGAVAASVLAALAALPLIRPLVQPAQERFAVIAGERL